MRFHVEDNDDAFGEYHSHDGTVDIWLGGHMTEFGLYDTILHEELHRIIEENCPCPTTEKQDHWVIQRLCF